MGSSLLPGGSAACLVWALAGDAPLLGAEARVPLPEMQFSSPSTLFEMISFPAQETAGGFTPRMVNSQGAYRQNRHPASGTVLSVGPLWKGIPLADLSEGGRHSSASLPPPPPRLRFPLVRALPSASPCAEIPHALGQPARTCFPCESPGQARRATWCFSGGRKALSPS